MDDLIYGEPQPVPGAVADTTAPKVTLKGVKKELDVKQLAKGVKVKVATDEAASIEADLVAKAKSIEFARAGTAVTLASKSLELGSGERQLKLKPKRGVLKGADSLKAEVRVTATDAAGNETTAKKKIKVG